MNKRKIFLSSFLILFLFASAYYVFSLRQRENKKYLETRSLMGTFVSIQVCLVNNQKEEVVTALKVAWERLEAISRDMSVFEPESEVSQINSSSGSIVTISSDLYQLLEKSVKYSHLTQGAFDVTVMPLIRLWKKSGQEGRIPKPSEIQGVKNLVSAENIEFLGGNRIRLRVKGTQLNLGAVAKGYAVDEAARILRESNITNFFIDAGGDLYVSGHNCRRKSWSIGIRDPLDKTKIFDVIHIVDAAVTTSGDYEQFSLIDGKKYSHIIDPRSGYPQQGVISATVIAPTALEADALSTALCVLSPDAGISLLNSLGGNYAGLVVSLTEDSGVAIIESEKYKEYQLITK